MGNWRIFELFLTSIATVERGKKKIENQYQHNVSCHLRIMKRIEWAPDIRVMSLIYLLVFKIIVSVETVYQFPTE